MPLATDVLSGARADDGLYIPLIERIAAGLNTAGRLVVGACQMSALSTRAYVAEHQHFYLSPLPFTGTTAEAMVDWSSEGIGQDSAGKLERVLRSNDRGDAVLAAAGDEVERTCGREAGAAEGAHGCSWFDRPCMPSDRPQGWTRVGPMRSKSSRPSRQPEVGGAPDHRRSGALGGDCARAQRATGRRVAQHCVGPADRASDS